MRETFKLEGVDRDNLYIEIDGIKCHVDNEGAEIINNKLNQLSTALTWMDQVLDEINIETKEQTGKQFEDTIAFIVQNANKYLKKENEELKHNLSQKTAEYNGLRTKFETLKQEREEARKAQQELNDEAISEWETLQNHLDDIITQAIINMYDNKLTQAEELMRKVLTELDIEG